MTGHRKFSDIRREPTQTPAKDAKIEQIRRAVIDARELGRIRESRNMRQIDVARTLSMTQANVSRIEREENLYLSTLRQYIEALGGELVVQAVFPDETVVLAPGGQDASEESRGQAHPGKTAGVTQH